MNIFKEKKGFTLVEMMVSISIFVIVAFTITATLVAVSNANRKAQELKQIMDNLNFSIQAMVLRLREGSSYTCADAGNVDTIDPVEGGQACLGPGGFGNAIVFNDPTPPDLSGNKRPVKYYLAEQSGGGNSVCDGATTGRVKHILKYDNVAGNISEVDITSPEVDICELKFWVGGVPRGEEQKPFVVIYIKGVAKLRNGDKSPFNLQTFVTQHN